MLRSILIPVNAVLTMITMVAHVAFTIAVSLFAVVLAEAIMAPFISDAYYLRLASVSVALIMWPTLMATAITDVGDYYFSFGADWDESTPFSKRWFADHMAASSHYVRPFIQACSASLALIGYALFQTLAVPATAAAAEMAGLHSAWPVLAMAVFTLGAGAYGYSFLHKAVFDVHLLEV